MYDSEEVFSSEREEESDTSNTTDLDSGWLVFPLSVEQADEVCINLNRLITDGKIPKTGIFYKHLETVVHLFINPNNHVYDPEVVEFFNTMKYLGGERTKNFVVGPMSHGHGQLGKGYFNTHHHKGNFYGPCRSTFTISLFQAEYTVKSGTINHFVQSFLLMCQSHDSPLFKNNVVKVFACAMENDGKALKAGL